MNGRYPNFNPDSFVGSVFGKIKVTSYEGKGKHGQLRYSIVCECGKVEVRDKTNIQKKVECETCAREKSAICVKGNENKKLEGTTVGKLQVDKVIKFGKVRYAIVTCDCGRKERTRLGQIKGCGRKRTCTQCTQEYNAEARKGIKKQAFIWANEFEKEKEWELNKAKQQKTEQQLTASSRRALMAQILASKAPQGKPSSTQPLTNGSTDL